MDMQNVMEQGRDVNTRRLPYYKYMVEKKNKKTTLHVHLLSNTFYCTTRICNIYRVYCLIVFLCHISINKYGSYLLIRNWAGLKWRPVLKV